MSRSRRRCSRLPVFPRDTILGPEMKSTGEVMGLDSSFERAFAKAQLGCRRHSSDGGPGVRVDQGRPDKKGLPSLPAGWNDMGFSMLATRGTAARIREAGLAVTVVPTRCWKAGRMRRCDPVGRNPVGDQYRLATAVGRRQLSIRRSALTHGVPHYTTLAGARAAVARNCSIESGNA